MSTTFLILKNYVGRFLGESDGSGTDSTRDALINDALIETASRYPFACFKKTTTLTPSSGVIDLPNDFDYSHLDSVRVYTYSDNSKYEYITVDLDDLSGYSSSEYAFSIDQENGHLKATQDVALTFEYQAVPAVMDDNTDTTKFPIPEAIARLAAGQYWQSIEEEPDQAQLNLQIADNLIQKAIIRDKVNRPVGKINGTHRRLTGIANLGYHR